MPLSNLNALNILAVILLAVAVTLVVMTHRYIRNRIIVSGEVTALIEEPTSKGDKVFKIEASFIDKSGRPQVYQSSFSSSSPSYNVGDPIRICYKEGNPSDSGIYSFAYRFGFAWGIGIFAFAILGMTLGFRYGSAIMDAIYLRGR